MKVITTQQAFLALSMADKITNWIYGKPNEPISKDGVMELLRKVALVHEIWAKPYGNEMEQLILKCREKGMGPIYANTYWEWRIVLEGENVKWAAAYLLMD